MLSNSRRAEASPSCWPCLTLPAQAAVTYLPLISFGAAGRHRWLLMASVLLLIRPWVLAWSVFGAIAAGTAIVACTVAELDANQTIYITVADAPTGLVISSVIRLSDTDVHRR